MLRWILSEASPYVAKSVLDSVRGVGANSAFPLPPTPLPFPIQGVALFGKSGSTLVVSLLRALRSAVGVHSALSPAQFSSKGRYAKQRLALVVQAGQAAEALHKESVIRRKLTRKHTKPYTT